MYLQYYKLKLRNFENINLFKNNNKPIVYYINNIFNENNSQNKQKKLEEWHCFTFLPIFLMSGVIEGSWIHISASAFSFFITCNVVSRKLYNWNIKSEKAKNFCICILCIIIKNNSNLAIRDPQWALDHAFRTAALERQVLQIKQPFGKLK